MHAEGCVTPRDRNVPPPHPPRTIDTWQYVAITDRGRVLSFIH